MAQGLPTSSGLGDDVVVFALALGVPDGVDRRQVDHVEAQSRHVLQTALGDP